tara:strand:- start:938 stop:1153 length:216 start_codon:yes stop_codon:yes gene_type:complete
MYLMNSDMPHYRRANSGKVYSQEEYLKVLEKNAQKEPKKPRGRPKGSLNGSSKNNKLTLKISHETFILSFD